MNIPGWMTEYEPQGLNVGYKPQAGLQLNPTIENLQKGEEACLTGLFIDLCRNGLCI